ncbi:putative mitochondrial hypothetical protein [Leptomonas pyrrhocoris]|uniref:Uncharacterized protein n=1 Tax=Leptomonas pyrrhocoris TaxID=157538 RepID=A0A0N1J505_LEPPY|nr:putative mitochondrial hypothetical protein [Leptomonas pyrrhocoris]XP_015660658.1 putative mitochondrial hypothetical protein [Leptomonas pyrrhocoris]KPA82218.1 putative mitochondrial hypothetical protein [Leptomonas pyrrhocoris]KPA82219.1 putative mitochondrial hypothetical protein [Leptomonas pyrrhocoris]|eukprot:XP_015660657.1 putative mitochondrial hypothetical protein [Leptomonas pyrrhocoris]
MPRLSLFHAGERKRFIAFRRFPTCSAVAALRRQPHVRLAPLLKTSALSDTWTGRCFCFTLPGSTRHTLNQDASLAFDEESNSHDPSTETPRRGVNTKQLVESLEQVNQLQSRLLLQFVNLPLDRRVLYRDHLLQESVTRYQKGLRNVFLALQRHVGNSAAAQNGFPPLTRAMLQSMKTAWLTLKGLSPTPPKDAALKGAHLEEIRSFYSALLCSGLPTRERDVGLVLEELQSSELLEPSASFYESVFIASWTLTDVQRPPAVGEATRTASTTARDTTSFSSVSPDLVVGEAKQLRRDLAGDLACHYMGHALAQPVSFSAQHHAAVRRETWEVFFCTFANTQPAPKLMDLWWTRFLEWADNQQAAQQSDHPVESRTTSTSDLGVVSAPSAPLPYQAVHAVLAWCAQSRDIERALKYFNAVNQRGVTLHASTNSGSTLPLTLADSFRRPGSLTAKSTSAIVQELQLALLVKLMASTKSVKLDGGLRALVVRDVQRQVDPAVLYAAPWGVLNDLLSGLSVPSAMQLLRRCSLVTSDCATDEQGAADGAPDEAAEKKASGVDKKNGREIPFYIWASLLRRCCREHLQDQAESLFLFLRRQFRLSVAEKRELIEIVMRMYTTMQPSDFPSALDLFLQHILRTPPDEPAVQPDGVLYELLIKAADSRNASMMLFLEACANGVTLTAELFEALMNSTQLKTVASLSRKLPHDYASSSLDAQLKIPAEADAHLRREEALRARGKPLYDSTGDAG